MEPGIWDRTIERLRSSIRCVAPWQPAHGPASAPAADFSMAAWADWLDELLERAGVEGATLVGHSMGGMLAMEMAARHPQRVRGLALVSTIAEAWDQDVRALWASMVEPVATSWGPETALENAQLLLGENYLGRNPDFVDGWRRRVAGYALRGLTSLGRAIGERPDYREVLRTCGIPILVVHGEADVAIPVEVARILAPSLGAPLVTFEGVGHCPPLDAPERFASALIDFLQTQGLLPLDERTASPAAAG